MFIDLHKTREFVLVLAKATPSEWHIVFAKPTFHFKIPSPSANTLAKGGFLWDSDANTKTRTKIYLRNFYQLLLILVTVTQNKYTLGAVSPLLISSKHLVRLFNLLKGTAGSEQTDNSVKCLLNPQGNNFLSNQRCCETFENWFAWRQRNLAQKWTVISIKTQVSFVTRKALSI